MLEQVAKYQLQVQETRESARIDGKPDFSTRKVPEVSPLTVGPTPSQEQGVVPADAEASNVETCGVTLHLAPDLHDGVKKSNFFFR